MQFLEEYSEKDQTFADIIKSAVDPRGGSVEMNKSASKFGKIILFPKNGMSFTHSSKNEWCSKERSLFVSFVKN